MDNSSISETDINDNLSDESSVSDDYTTCIICSSEFISDDDTRTCRLCKNKIRVQCKSRSHISTSPNPCNNFKIINKEDIYFLVSLS